jgi:hypothetical protein
MCCDADPSERGPAAPARAVVRLQRPQLARAEPVPNPTGAEGPRRHRAPSPRRARTREKRFHAASGWPDRAWPRAAPPRGGAEPHPPRHHLADRAASPDRGRRSVLVRRDPDGARGAIHPRIVVDGRRPADRIAHTDEMAPRFRLQERGLGPEELSAGYATASRNSPTTVLQGSTTPAAAADQASPTGPASGRAKRRTRPLFASTRPTNRRREASRPGCFRATRGRESG